MSSNLAPPPPLRRVCALPTCDENCSYCRENDRIAAARRGLPFLTPDVAAEPSPTQIPRLAFGAPAAAPVAAEGLALLADIAAAAEPAAEGLALLADVAAAAEPIAEPAVAEPAVAEPAAGLAPYPRAPAPAPIRWVHPGVEAAAAAVAAGTIAPGSSESWALILGTTNAPTLEEYNAMTREQQGAWTCIICGWEPALADAPQPGRVCSYECMYNKYR